MFTRGTDLALASIVRGILVILAALARLGCRSPAVLQQLLVLNKFSANSNSHTGRRKRTRGPFV